MGRGGYATWANSTSRWPSETVRAIQREAEALKNSSYDVEIEPEREKRDGTLKPGIWRSDRLAGWGRASEAASKLVAISKRAAAMMSVHQDALDADPMCINVANGTLRIAKCDDGPYVHLTPHNPADLITKISPVAYDPDATCPLFDRFMNEVQPPSPDTGKSAIQAFLDQWAGLSLTGDVGDQKMTFLYGKGRNGKGVWVNTVSFVAGDYAGSISIESFLDSGKSKSGGQATPDIAKLPGVRLLSTSEPEKGAKFHEGFVKLFTGGDVISARHLNKEFFDFKPQAKITMQGNYRPRISGTDEGIWGRIILVPWLQFIPPDRRDKKLFDKLKAEGSGILNRLLDGLCQWLDHGLVIPDQVREATEAYRADSDPLGNFLAVCVQEAIGEQVRSSDMHALFSAWAKVNGETQWTSKGLGSALLERGLRSRKSSVNYWVDVKLTKSVDDFLDAHGQPKHDDGGPDDEADDDREWEREP